MIPTIAALLLAPSTPEGQWGPTTLTPVALARRVDQALATLKGVTMHFVYVYDAKETWGMKACEGTFVSPTKFRVEVPVYSPNKEPLISFQTWVADGTRFGSADSSKFPKPQMPLVRRPKGPARPASLWFADCSRTMLSGVGQETHPVERFVVDAKAQGYNVGVQSRWLNFRGRHVTWYRLLAIKGAVRCETVFDATGYLPVGVTNVKPGVSVKWHEGRWGKPKRIDATQATFIQAKSTTSPAPAPRPR